MVVKMDPDADLIREIQEGSEEAFNCLVRRHQEAICRISYRICGNMEEARDIAQEVFLLAYKILPKWRFDAKFFTWLYQTTINRARGNMRKRRKTDYYEELPVDMNTEPQSSIRNDLIAREKKIRIKLAIQELPKRQQEVVLLRIFENMSIQETSEIMKCKAGTVKALLFQALKRLSNDLKKEKQHGDLQT